MSMYQQCMLLPALQQKVCMSVAYELDIDAMLLSSHITSRIKLDPAKQLVQSHKRGLYFMAHNAISMQEPELPASSASSLASPHASPEFNARQSMKAWRFEQPNLILDVQLGVSSGIQAYAHSFQANIAHKHFSYCLI